MDFFPFFIQLHQKKCLIVGGGDVAFRKLFLLNKAQAKIRVVAPIINSEIKENFQNSHCEIIEECYQLKHLDGVDFVIAATDDHVLNQQISQDAKQRKLLVNVVDGPELSDFIFPAIVDRSPMTVAISTDGLSPVLARLTRAKIEALLPQQYGKLAELGKNFRDAVKTTLPSLEQRRHFWDSVFQGPIAESVLNGDMHAALQQLAALLANPASVTQGEVYLVGAGPGDPDLLTFRALRLMQQADIVLYDRLIPPEILELTRRDAIKINVGKMPKSHPVPQTEINQLLVKYAREGKRVLRLKGGDPFIFGRGGEEIAELADAKIPFQVVPGITAASGCAAYAGIPLTHRDYAQSVRFVTGHLKNDDCELSWDKTLNANETLVVYMGVAGLEVMSQKLIAQGMEPTMPAAVIERGTLAIQRVLVGDISTIAELAKHAKIEAPSLLIIGEVVKLHKQLQWFKVQEPENISQKPK